VSVIFGLDPAGPLFWMDKPKERLDVNDADHTISLHTNGGTLGFYQPISKVDIYPNGGASQPGWGIDLTGACAHGRSYEYFSEAATSKKFLAKQCSSFDNAKNGKCDGSSVVFLAETASLSFNGIYHFTTQKSSPYAMG
jgi:pancreatic triacylglycerol lipase